jgi:hypothetical protein
MEFFRRAFATLVVALSVVAAASASAASFSTDQSDIWWANPPGTENGWGFQLVQRNSTIFATMFVYAPSTSPTWYAATMTPTGTANEWSGDLATTTGPWFGTAPFNPANVTVRKVGTMTWKATSVTTGTLSYTVDGVAVSKDATRQTLVAENYSGHFGGGIHETDTGCANPAFNTTSENIGALNITQNGAAITMIAASNANTCSYAGVLAQFGQFGDVFGTFACGNGANGSFHLFEFQVTEFSIIGRFTAAYSNPAGCQGSGWFGGMKVTTF